MKTFNLLFNNQVVLQNKPMPLIMATKNKLRKMKQYQPSYLLKITYNGKS